MNGLSDRNEPVWRILFRFTCLFLLGLIATLVLISNPVHSRLPETGLAAIHVPRGFKVEKVAGSELGSYPMMGTIDDRGRLFLCESSGNTLTTAQMAAKPDYHIRMLEDTNGDGIYDRSTIFAEHLTLPAGAAWYRGSLYVAAPPDLLRFDDTDNDGVADHREVIVHGWNLSANAASLHGPFMGPDGWLYLTDGRHGFDITSKEGKVYKGLASRIWRLRPDGSGLEWVAGGGFDNPVELVFENTGETIGTMTYFQDPRDGQRDALLHYVYGGVYPKWFSVVSEFKRTGDLMPVMTKFARIAPAGLVRYRGSSFGPGYEGNLFSAQFNPHRVQRHVLHREGATFRTEDEDFLTSTDPDFHPTDVMEDADGSLLVVDTGAWFINGCPISRVAKPEIRGSIYRIRRVGAPVVKDPRGEALQLESKPPGDLTHYLEDRRPFVQDRALELMVAAGPAAVQALAGVRQRSASADVRSRAVWGLFRIGTPDAQTQVRAALRDASFTVRIAAATAVGMAKDREAVDSLMDMVKQDQPAARRQAATALGQIGDARAIPALVLGAARADERFIEHAVIYALIQLGNAEAVAPALKSSNFRVRKAALIALDQMDRSPLTARQFAPFLNEPNQELRTAALWVVSHHQDWTSEVLTSLDARLRAPELRPAEIGPVRDVLLSFCADTGVQKLIASRLGDPAAGPARQMFLLDTIDRCSLKELPQAWTGLLGELLDHSDAAVRLRVVSLVRSRQLDGLDDKLQNIAANTTTSSELRVAAIGALVSRHPSLDDASIQFLLGHLNEKTDAALRLSAAQALSRSHMTDAQLIRVAQGYLPRVDALVLASLLDAYRADKSEAVGQAMIAGLLKSPVSIGEPDARRLQEILGAYPESVRTAARPLLARLEELQRERIKRLQKMEPLLHAGGDVGRGRRIFFGDKVACYTCHTIGNQGGHVGPDLTGVGAIRSGHDLLEAIVFPSASFVPGHEVYIVETATERYSGVRGEGDANSLTLITGPGPDGTVRIPRQKVQSIRPSTVSLMPEGLDESLTRAEFIDLLAFLQQQTSRETAQNQPH
jgi:putative membrane-bound dehydrogenase-like protein